ncbi:MAG: hypothetical protein ACRD0N_13745 [Acidimicrobiales bacterium]
MRMRAALAGLLAALVVGAGCGDGPDDESSRASEDTTTTTTTSAAAIPTTTAQPAGSSTSSTATPRSTVAQATTTTTAAAGSAQASGAATFPRPGTYRYTSTGTFTASIGLPQTRNGEATLTVDPANGTDQHSVKAAPGRSTDQVLRLDGGNVHLVSLRLTESGFTKEFRPQPPGLALPAGAAPGRTWSWQASSTDGQTQVSSSFRAVRTETVTVGTAQVEALVVEVALSTAGDIALTSTQTMWAVPRLGLIVRQDDATQGRLGAITFTSNASDRLISLDPS